MEIYVYFHYCISDVKITDVNPSFCGPNYWQGIIQVDALPKVVEEMPSLAIFKKTMTDVMPHDYSYIVDKSSDIYPMFVRIYAFMVWLTRRICLVN